MRHCPLFLFTLLIFLLYGTRSLATPRPYVKFILKTSPDCRFAPKQGAIVVSEDSSLTHPDTLQPRTFPIDYCNKNGIYGYGHVLSARQGRWLNEYPLRLILYSGSDSMVSNIFWLSRPKAEVIAFISDRGLEVHESFRSAHRQLVVAIQFASIFFIIRFIVLLLFYLRPATTWRQYLHIAFVSVICTAITLLATIGIGYPPFGIFVLVLPAWIFGEALLLKRYTFHGYSWIYIVASILFSFLPASLVGLIFFAFNL